MRCPPFPPFGLPFVVLLVGSFLLTPGPRGEAAQKPGNPVGVELYTWESVGEITAISKQTLSIRRILRISDDSWGLEPGAVAESSALGEGDQILAKGKTQADGTFDTRRIYVVAPSVSRQGAGGAQVEQAADHGAPESRVPTIITDPSGTRPESRGRGADSGPASRLPGPTGPGGQKPVGAGLQANRSPNLPRFFAGDAEGIIYKINSRSIVLSQSFFTDNNTIIRDPSGRILKLKDLKQGQRVAVTVKDEQDSKTQAIKARVIRLLP
jgi:hypothetical protein